MTGYDGRVLSELDVKKLSKVEKLRLFEVIWSDLASNDEDILSPDWHHSALKQTELLVADGKAHFSDWAVARERIRTTVSNS